MDSLKLCASDLRFMLLVWAHEPIHSAALVTLCQDKMGWKKSTTYTMIKKLAEKGYVQNINSTVTALIPKEKVQAFESGYVVEQSFAGSLPAFIASFLSQHPLKKNEIEEIRYMLEQQKGERT